MPFASDPVNFWIKLVTRFPPPLAPAAASDDRRRASGPPAPGLSFHRSCGGRNQAGPAGGRRPHAARAVAMPALVLSEITLSSNSEIAPTIENTMRPTAV